MNTGYYGGYCGSQVLDSYKLESDLQTGGQVGLDGFCSDKVLGSEKL